mmetsp:Transcript_94827/g.268084  ORF Transcript_94827/g.268084 Transcript_94827/m.268084 type:complete len:237 (-) Transcript_94827:55-765(-)
MGEGGDSALAESAGCQRHEEHAAGGTNEGGAAPIAELEDCMGKLLSELRRWNPRPLKAQAELPDRFLGLPRQPQQHSPGRHHQRRAIGRVCRPAAAAAAEEAAPERDVPGNARLLAGRVGRARLRRPAEGCAGAPHQGLPKAGRAAEQGVGGLLRPEPRRRARSGAARQGGAAALCGKLQRPMIQNPAGDVWCRSLERSRTPAGALSHCVWRGGSLELAISGRARAPPVHPGHSLR